MSISCYEGKRTEEGSCNACQCRDDDKVIVVKLRTLSIRLCHECAKEMKNALAAVTKRRRGV